MNNEPNNTTAPARLDRRDLQYTVGNTAKARYEITRRRHAGVAKREAEAAANLHPDMPLVGREIFGRLYNPDAAKAEPVSQDAITQVAGAVHKALDALPAWQQLQAQCGYNGLLAAATCATLMDEVYGGLELPEVPPEEGEAPEAHAERQGEALAEWAASLAEDAQDQALLRAKIGRVLAKANTEAAALEAAVGAGFGLGSAELASKHPDLSLELAQNWSTNARFKRALQLLGAFRNSFGAARRRLPSPGHVVPFGVEPGRDIGRLLPSEKGALVNAPTALATLHRLMLGQTLQYQMRSSRPMERGPFHVALDTSGSMHGQRIEVATAFTCAALVLAHREGRKVALTRFDTTTTTFTDLDLETPGGVLAAMRQISAIGANGGTNFNGLFTNLWHGFHEAADLLLISDGEGEVRADVLDKALKGTDLHYISVGTKGLAALRERAVAVYTVADLTDTDAALAGLVANAARVH